MTEHLTREQVREFWRDQALKHGQSPSASWSDQPVIDLEIREILRFLSDGDQVLDIGCANGFSTVHLAAQRRIHILGLDYIPEMIDQAKIRLAGLNGQLAGRVSFGVGNIMALEQPAAAYDKVVVIRVIINLGEWANQLRGFKECARVLKPGGLLLLSEATLQGWNQLNAFRQEWGLPDIPMPGFNNYLDQERVVAETSADFETVDIVNFASSYFVGTRLLKPLLAQTLGADVEVANPNLHWNRWFANLPPAGDYGTQKLFVLKKR